MSINIYADLSLNAWASYNSLIELELTALWPLRRIEMETYLSMGKEVPRYGATALGQKRQHIMGEREGERERKAWVK